MITATYNLNHLQTDTKSGLVYSQPILPSFFSLSFKKDNEQLKEIRNKLHTISFNISILKNKFLIFRMSYLN